MVAFTAQFPSGDAISCLHGDGCHRTAGALWQGGHRRSSPAAFCGRVCVILLEHVCAFRGKGMRNWRLHVGVGDTAVSVSVQDARLENRSVLPAQNAAQMQITHLRSHLQLLLILFPLFVTHCTLLRNIDFQERAKKLTALVPKSLSSMLILISASCHNCSSG